MYDIKELVLEEAKKGNIVLNTIEGLASYNLEEIIDQHVDGLLYDLNRNEAIILTFIDDPKWINDYACMLVIKRLKEKLDEKNI